MAVACKIKQKIIIAGNSHFIFLLIKLYTFFAVLARSAFAVGLVFDMGEGYVDDIFNVLII